MRWRRAMSRAERPIDLGRVASARVQWHRAAQLAQGIAEVHIARRMDERLRDIVAAPLRVCRTVHRPTPGDLR
jgi:hypothetical protein